MPVIEVWCLPVDQTEDDLRRLHQAIVQAVVGVPELHLRNQNDMTVLFPTDLMKYGLGEEIIVKIEMFERPERSLKVKQSLAKNVGMAVKMLYPKAKVESGPVKTFRPETDGFWSSNQ